MTYEDLLPSPDDLEPKGGARPGGTRDEQGLDSWGSFSPPSRESGPPDRRRPLAAFGWVLGGYILAGFVGMALLWGTFLGSVFLEQALGLPTVAWPPEGWDEMARVESFDGLAPDAAGPAVPDPEARADAVADYRETLRSSWSANVLLAWFLGLVAPGYALLGWLQRRDFLRRHPEHPTQGAQGAQVAEEAEAAGRGPGLSTVRSVTAGLLLGAGIGGLSTFLASTFEGLPRPPVSLDPGQFNLLATTPFGFCLALLVGGLAFPLAEELFFRGWTYPYLEHNAGRIAAYLGSAGLWAWSTTSDLSPAPFLQALVIGLCFAWAYDRWRSLLVPGIAHATMSGVVLVLSNMQAPPL